MLFGFSLTAIYMTILIVIGCCTVVYLFFADLADGAAEGIPFFEPAVMLSFITFTAAAGYVLETFTSLNSILNVILAMFLAVIGSVLLYYFLLVPLRSAEVSTAYTDASLEGQTAKVIVPIPLDGFGEIVIETVNGMIAKRAASYHETKIPYGMQVLIIEVRESTAYVAIYEKTDIF